MCACVLQAACLAFVATTVALAVRFPVKKHKFARTSCVSHADLAALEISAVFVAAPLAVEYECDQQRARSRPRTLSFVSLRVIGGVSRGVKYTKTSAMSVYKTREKARGVIFVFCVRLCAGVVRAE